MKVTQVYEILSTITSEILGESAIVNEDLSNVVDLGNEIINADAIDNYVKSLVDHIGRVVFVNRTYTGRGITLLRDGWEFGSILEKVSMKLPDATANESWELENGTSYDPNIFYKPTVTAKFYNSKVTFEIPMSFSEMQVKESFSNATQLNSFFSMIQTGISNALTVKLESLTMRTLNTLVAESINADFADGDYTKVGGTHAINLLARYKAVHPDSTLTATTCLTDSDFLVFSANQIMQTMDNIKNISTLFNVGGTEKFTNAENLRAVMLSEFIRNSDAYARSTTFHDEFVKIPENNREIISYWQGSGTSFDFADKSKIDIKSPSGATVTTSGVLAVIFDRDACGVCNENRRTTSNYNPKAEFYTNWAKSDCSYFVDTNENAVVFLVA